MLVGYIFCFFWEVFFITDFPSPDVWVFLLFDIQSFHFDQISIAKHSSNDDTLQLKDKQTNIQTNTLKRVITSVISFSFFC